MANREEYIKRDKSKDVRIKYKKERQTINIDFARGLTDEALIDILQHELLRARTSGRDEVEVHLPQAIAHELKFRISTYVEAYGSIDDALDKKEGRSSNA